MTQKPNLDPAEKADKAPLSPAGQAPLESWKDIAAYLNRTVRTVKRWEQEEKLPVHRLMHLSRASVYAYPGELDAWKQKRNPAAEAGGFFFRRLVRLPAFAMTLLLALVTAGSSLTHPTGASAQERGVSLRRLAATPGMELGSPSPDGRQLTGVDWETGDLIVRDLATGRNRQLTNKGTWAESPEYACCSTAYSPDGQHIAYVWYNRADNPELRVMRDDGSGVRVLLSNPEINYVDVAGWTPDGGQVAVTVWTRGRANQIALVSVADGAFRAVKTFDWRVPFKTSISPDGRWLVYDLPATPETHDRDIFLLATDGSREVPLVEHSANDLHPVWSPDGRHVFFASDRTGAMSAWLIPVEDGRAAGPPEMVKQGVGNVFYPMGFTSAGALFYSSQVGHGDVFVAALEPETGRVLGAPQQAIERAYGFSESAAWSADGSRMVYLTQRGMVTLGHSAEMVVREVKSGREFQPQLPLRFNRRWSQPRWSPDGRFLLATATDDKGRGNLFLIDPDSRKVTPLLEGPFRGRALWMPDGKSIVIPRRREAGQQVRRSFVVRDLASGREREIVSFALSLEAPGLVADPASADVHAPVNVTDIHSPALSPDGRQLAYVWHAGQMEAIGISVVPTAGGEPREVLRLPNTSRIPGRVGLVWTPDGRLLFGVTQYDARRGVQEDRVELWQVPATGGTPQRIGVAMNNLRHLAAHPDGSRILFTSGEMKYETWVMENFLPVQKANR